MFNDKPMHSLMTRLLRSWIHRNFISFALYYHRPKQKFCRRYA